LKLVLVCLQSLKFESSKTAGARAPKFYVEVVLGRTKLYKNFGRIGQAIRHLIGRQLSSLTFYFSKTIRVRRPKFYVHKHRVRIFIVYKFSQNRITKGGEKGNLFYLRIQLNQENRVVKFYLLIIYNFDS